MKKLLLTTALVGVAFTAAPAMAEVSLGLGGHFKGYVTWHDQDDENGVAPGAVGRTDANDFDIIRETEIHFTGETTLDNGLTVGFHVESEADAGNGFEVEESYAYFAGNWGRVNFGAEDGAAYLLQVAAPSADNNVDGIRQYVNPINYNLANNDTNAVALANGFDFQRVGSVAALDNAGLTNSVFDYDHSATGASDKITYITPVFSGFQAAASYTPDFGSASSFGVGDQDAVNGFGDAWELAARYEGQFNAVRLALGAGYSNTELEATAALVGGVLPAGVGVANFSDDVETWNVGANLGFGPFNVGAAYLHSDNGDIVTGVGATRSTDSDARTWVLGADYTTGPFVLGVSYYDQDREVGAAGDLETNRYSGGVTYTYGPGMSFRGSVHHVEQEIGASDFDATSLLLGTQIGF